MSKREYKPKDPKVVSYGMSRIKGKDTKIELKIRQYLYKQGYRYRCNDKRVFGHPDIVFPSLKIAIFCDSEFWHGYNFEEAKDNIKIHQDYWIPKIERNIERDKEVNKRLKEEGYSVLRFWGFDIDKNFEEVIAKIEEEIALKKHLADLRNSIQERTTLGYLFKGDSVLLLYRNKKKNDPNQGKWIGIGGHIENGESIASCFKREANEETGLKVRKAHYEGYVDFLNEKYPAERMYLYTSDTFEGEISADCDEGELKWVKYDEAKNLPMWEGDKFFFPLLRQNKGCFELTLHYDGDTLLDVIGPVYKKKNGKAKR